MGKPVPKMSARIVSAIRNLRESHGSTSKEIMNYILSQYNASEATIHRQMQAALKRGLDYGILKKNNGHYILNTDADSPQMASALAPVERSHRRRKRSKRRRSRRRRSGRRGSRRRRSRRRKRSRGRRRRGRRRSKGRRRRRSRRRRGRRRAVAAKRMSGCTNCRCTRKSKEMQVLQNDPEQQSPEKVGSRYDQEPDVDRRRKASRSRDRSLTLSQSTANSDREGCDDRREEC